MVAQCNNQFAHEDGNLVCKDSNAEKIQMAEDAAYALGNGAVPTDIITPYVPKVEMSRSLAPFTMIVDAKGNYHSQLFTILVN